MSTKMFTKVVTCNFSLYLRLSTGKSIRKCTKVCFQNICHATKSPLLSRLVNIPSQTWECQSIRQCSSLLYRNSREMFLGVLKNRRAIMGARDKKQRRVACQTSHSVNQTELFRFSLCSLHTHNKGLMCNSDWLTKGQRHQKGQGTGSIRID